MKKSYMEPNPLPSQQSKCSFKDIKHTPSTTSPDVRSIQNQPGGSEVCSKCLQEGSSINEGSEIDSNSLQESSSSNKSQRCSSLHENEKSKGTPVLVTSRSTDNNANDLGSSIFHEQNLCDDGNDAIYTSEMSTSNSSEIEKSDILTLRELFPDLSIPDENLTLHRLRQMSTTDLTRQIVSLNKPAVLKPVTRLIPPEKSWLTPLSEVDKKQEDAEEKEMAIWINGSDTESGSETEEEVQEVNQTKPEASTSSNIRKNIPK